MESLEEDTGLLACFGRIDTQDLLPWFFPSWRNLSASYSFVCLSSSLHSASCRACRLEHTALRDCGPLFSEKARAWFFVVFFHSVFLFFSMLLLISAAFIHLIISLGCYGEKLSNAGLRYLSVTQYLLNKYLFVEYIEWMYMNESWLFNTFW